MMHVSKIILHGEELDVGGAYQTADDVPFDSDKSVKDVIQDLIDNNSDTNGSSENIYDYNPNLLVNWYWQNSRDIINRRGLPSYNSQNNSSTHSIDMWDITRCEMGMYGTGLTLEWLNYSSTFDGVLSQMVRLFNCTQSNMLTFSIIINEELYTCSHTTYDGRSWDTSSHPLDESGIYSVKFDKDSSSTLKVEFHFHSEDPIKVTAAKLELGDRQTLAHKNEDGEWVLNEFPNYAEQYAICEQYSPITGEFVGSQRSNPNLLDNWDFVNPINRNGKTIYTGIGYAIDRWYINEESTSIELTENGIALSNNASSIYQTSRISIPAKTELILSALVFDSNNLSLNVQFFADDPRISGPLSPTSSDAFENVLREEELNLITTRFVSPSKPCKYIRFIITSAYGISGKNVCIRAAKLEFGSVQTLAHPNKDDEWIINEVPKYSEQYSICSRYDLITGEFVGSQHSNPNLLDNWYFIGGGSQQGNGRFPINQRGETEYSVAGYTIDRWKGDLRTSAKVEIADGYVRGTKLSTADSSVNALYQLIESPKNLAGRTVTLSAMRRGTGRFQMVLLANSILTGTAEFPSSDDWTVNSITATLPDTLTSLSVFLYFDISGTSETGYTDFKAVKLELGSVQTLAHKEGDEWVLNDPPPNYALELEKCQRHQVVYNSGENIIFCGNCHSYTNSDAYLLFQLPSCLRSNPTITYSGTIAAVVGTYNADEYCANVTSIKQNATLANHIVRITGTFAQPAISTPFEMGKNYPLVMQANSQLIFDANL